MSMTSAVATIIHAVSPVSIFNGAGAAGAGRAEEACSAGGAAGVGTACSSANTKPAIAKKLNNRNKLTIRFISNLRFFFAGLCPRYQDYSLKVERHVQTKDNGVVQFSVGVIRDTIDRLAGIAGQGEPPLENRLDTERFRNRNGHPSLEHTSMKCRVLVPCVGAS
jgi:hypothetical protein